MKLTHFQGLNCFYDCVISIADFLEIDYSIAFANLWTETEFHHDTYRKVYLSKRLHANLDLLGAKVQCFGCFSPNDVLERAALFNDSEFIIVGMDAFYIPWNHFYKVFHGPHYFIMKNEKKFMLTCMDPTYNRERELLTYEEFLNHTFDIGHISLVPKKSLQIKTLNEAQQITATHHDTRKILISQICNCVNQQQDDIVLLAKYIDTMIANRYLYRYFLKNHQASYGEAYLLFTDDYFSQWKAVKNGLYKTAVTKKKENVINNICTHFNNIVDEEMAIAKLFGNSVTV